jgi:hypothetical protein
VRFCSMESISSTIALLQLRGEQQAIHEFWWCGIGSQNAVPVHLPFVMCVKVWRAPQMVAVTHRGVHRRACNWCLGRARRGSSLLGLLHGRDGARMAK